MAEKTIPQLTDNPGLTGAALVEVSQNGSSYKATVDEWNALLTADVDTAVEAAEAAQTAAEAAQAAAEVAQADAGASSASAAQSAGLALTRANTAEASATPITANCTSCSGVRTSPQLSVG